MVVNGTLLYVPAVYPDPLAVIDPVSDCTSTVIVAPCPPPPSIETVGVVSYPAPALSKVRDDNLPVCSSNTGVTAAGVVGSSAGEFAVVMLTIGIFLYPKPWVFSVIVSISNPRVVLPAALIPVVSPVPRVNETDGALPDAYSPAAVIDTEVTPLPNNVLTTALDPVESVIVTAGPLL